jgi:argininosuccinate lyase
MKSEAVTATQPLWGGRFREALTEKAFAFSRSLEIDFKLLEDDIAGSIAHARMLGRCEIISLDESQTIIDALQRILLELTESGIGKYADCEDIHSLVESLLVEQIGDLGKKLHTARSRNDQVALDERLYLRRTVGSLIGSLQHCIVSLLTKAEGSIDIVMPGFTHLQHAQPVLASHHLLAYVAMFARDIERLQDALARSNHSPLGSAAFAGTPFAIDRRAVATELGFASVTINSIDSVSDRDHLIEIVSACSIVMMHLSRFTEELILWNTSEFQFITLPDRLCTGSSIMPQKKNPDMAELIRGKVGRVYGDLINLLTIMKGLPLAYNRDMQEDKQPLFDAIDTTTTSVEMATELVEGLEFNREKLAAQLRSGFLTATDLADYLVAKGLPFRDAHHVTGEITSYCINQELELSQVPFEKMQTFSSLIGSDIYSYLDPNTSVDRKRSSGSTSKSEVLNQLFQWKQLFQL